MRALRNLWAPTSRLYDRGDEGQPQKRVLDCSIGWQNYHDGNSWREIDAGHSEPDGNGFHARFTRTPRLIRLGEDGKKRVYPVPGNDQVWVQLRKPEELALGRPTSKRGGIWTWNRDAYAFSLVVGPSGIKFRLVLKRPVGVNTLHIPFDSRGLTRQGRRLLHDGEVVALLRTPTITHAGMNEDDEPIPVDVRFEPGMVVLEFDPAGMVYPISIDPPLDLQVEADTDDCIRYGATTFTLDGPQVPYWCHTSVDDIQWGCRWTSVTVPQGATIDTAYMSWCAIENQDNPGVTVTLRGEDADDSATFSTYTDFDNRLRTSASASYVVPSVSMNVWYDTSELKTLIKEVVDRASWASGNAMALLQDDPGTTGANISYGRSHDSDPTKAAKLHIEYTVAMAGIVGSRIAQVF